MTRNDDLTILDIEASPLSPLDLPPEEESPLPDPDEMLALLNSDAVLERMQAARAFCELEDERAILPLIKLLQDECPLVRVSVAYALGRNKSEKAIIPLIEQLNQDWNGYVRKGIVWALGTCRAALGLKPLISALKYDITAVRLWAASALGQLGDIEAIEPLMEALTKDTVSAVRGNCAWSLGKLIVQKRSEFETQDEIYHDAVDVLIYALDDEDLSVQTDARNALRKLGDPRGLKVLDRIEMEQGYCEF
ncbi:MAG: HEAT repeat domain-containing protein [Pseudanabaena sp.]|jgi:HEAT repeat protein|nr:HEAT repeat domain-containing protein [Pseudanabaena sp. M53BS1SP1A06MG]MCA6582995.1 HEAT repeat domain-containing protein [Pseudanabaena sp. M34BS1SP1A06MG]MCA6592672.1 HEAT repeat domain-containing protein [Pseudanabaena sp. M38BS1SP1A06MG]MCA6601881.1 HEAT repeat domain-containing protein [Pseudanabaena sp. M57BS1SP1A06MG]